MWPGEMPVKTRRSAPSTGAWGTPFRSPIPRTPPAGWEVRHLYIHSSSLAKREAARRQKEMEAIEAEIWRIQGLVNKYDYKTPEVIVRRVQKKAFKKRRAQKYFTIEVVNHPERSSAPLELRYHVDYEKVQRDAELDGV